MFGALLATTLLWTAPPVHAAGTLPLAMAQQVDINGRPLAGCQVSFFVAGTVATPQNAYSDFGLSLNPNSILSCDQAGRVPMFWLADGLVHVRLTDSAGASIIDTTMQVLGPSSGGGGGGSTVDSTTLLATGDMKARYGTGLLAGFVRLNGLTIGNATCGCSERANADTQNLWVYLYNTDPNLNVSGGRTGNALADFNANKQLTLPDWRGRALAFLDDMGNTAAGRLTTAGFGASATVLGASAGLETRNIGQTQLPNVTLPYSGSVTVTSSANNVVQGAVLTINNGGSAPITALANGAASGTLTSSGNYSGNTSSINGNVTQVGLPTVQPTALATIYIKL